MLTIDEKAALHREMELAADLPEEVYCRPYTATVEKWGSEFRVVWRKSISGRRWVPDSVSEAGACAMLGWNVENGMQDYIENVENWDDWFTVRRKRSGDDGRAASNVTRSRSRVRELAACNDWDYFATFTLAEEKQDRFDLAAWVKAFGYWIGNFNKKYCGKLQYIIIPERHKDGAWHAHGLLRGIPPEALEKNEHGYLDMPYYRARFGWISLSPVKDRTRCASYVTKYITKDMADTDRKRGEHLFYSSRGLKGREVWIKNVCSMYVPGSVWENEYCCIGWYKTAEEAYKAL